MTRLPMLRASWLVKILVLLPLYSSCSSAPHLDSSLGSLDRPPDIRSFELGTRDGSFHVDENGAAAYTLPIEVPPGRVNMQPELAFTYNSNRGYGAMGMGWAISGLSTISRCESTYWHNNKLRPVTYDDEDALCLDGQRLVLVAGTNAKNGAEYRTERDTFSKIVAFREPSSGDVEGFRVWTRNGNILEYGNTSNAQLQTSYGRYRLWALSRMEDRFGNYLEIEYTKVYQRFGPSSISVETEILPKEIRYAGNSGGTESQTLEPSNRISFYYSDHMLPHRGYYAGLPVTITKRLSRVEVRVQEIKQREYRLQYTESTSTGRTILKSITHCDKHVCMPPVVFDWQQSGSEFSEPINISDSLNLPPLAESLNDEDEFPVSIRHDLIDFDGDGKDDLVTILQQEENELILTYSPSTYSFEGHQDGAQTSPIFNAITVLRRFDLNGSVFLFDGIDFDRDQREDIFWGRAGAGGYTTLPEESNWYLIHKQSPNLTVMTDLGVRLRSFLDFGVQGQDKFVDLDGDGYADLLRFYSDRDNDSLYQIWFGNAKGFDNNTLLVTIPEIYCRERGWCDLSRGLLVDFNGNGAVDLLAEVYRDIDKRASGTLIGIEFVNRTPSFNSLNRFVAAQPNILFLTQNRPLDMNGDGLNDVFICKRTLDNDGCATVSKVHLSTGEGYLEEEFIKIHTDQSDVRYASISGGLSGDFNHDGIADFLDRNRSATMHLYLSGGESGLYNELETNIPSTLELIKMGDIDGNGGPDILGWDGDHLDAYLQTGKRADLIISIRETEVATASYSITYEPLSNPNVYRSTDCTSVYPSICVPGSNGYVVSEYTEDAGSRNEALSYQFTYENAHIDLLGNGWLGFEKVSMIDDARRTTTTTEYDLQGYGHGRRYFPFLGMPRRIVQETTLSDPFTIGIEQVYISILEQEFALLARPVGYFPYVSERRKREYLTDSRQYGANNNVLTDASLIRRMDITYRNIDNFGNVHNTIIDHGDGFITTIASEFENNAERWLIQKPKRQTVTSFTREFSAQTRNTHWTYDPETGFLKTMIEQGIAGDADPSRTTLIYEPDEYGNLAKVTVKDVAGNARSTTWVYDDPERMFPQLMVNALGHRYQYRFHPVHGQLSVEVDPNGEVARYAYDGFGRLGWIERADGSRFSQSFQLSSPGDSPEVRFWVETLTTGQPTIRTGYDRLGRPTEFTSTTLIGVPTKWTLEYNRLGHNIRQMLPKLTYLEKDEFYEYQYNELGQLRSYQAPNGLKLRFDYQRKASSGSGESSLGWSQLTLTPGAGWSSVTWNNRGLMESVRDVNYNTTEYRYGPFNQLREAEDALGNVTEFRYSDNGLLVELNDPDLGKRVYGYGSFGELAYSIDGEGNLARYEYDSLGRPTHIFDHAKGSWLEINGLLREYGARFLFTDPGFTTTWLYDSETNGNAVGRLSKLTGPDGHSEEYFYDSRGRFQKVVTSIDQKAYSTSFSYYDDGLLRTLHYPNSSLGTPFSVKYKYRNGFVYTVEDTYSGKLYWRREETNPLGQTRFESYGNGVVTEKNYFSDGRIKSVKSLNNIIDGKILQDKVTPKY